MPNYARYLRGFGRRKPSVAQARIDWSHPLARGLVGAWLFNEGGGTIAYDLSGKGNKGTLTSSPVWSVGFFSGPSLSFDGSASYVDLGTDASLNPSAVTAAAWVKASSLANTYSTVISRTDSSVPQSYYTLLVKSTGKLAFYVWGNADINYDGTGANTISVDNWYHLALTYDSSAGLKGYFNGFLDGSAAANGVLTSKSVTATVGKDTNTAGRIWNGLIDFPAIWNRALSAAEVAWLYAEPFAFMQQWAPKRAFFGPAAAAPAVGAFQAAWARPQAIIGTGVI